MSFTPGIPRSGQSLGNSRPQIQGNFDYINTAFAINHVAFNASGFGKHKFVQMPVQSFSPSTLADEGVLFTKTVSGISRLIWSRDADATEIELTGVNPNASANGWSTLPGGILVQWGTTTASNGTRNITFTDDGNLAFPNACWHVWAQSHIINITSNTNWSTANISQTGFALLTNPGGTPSGTPFSWFAIGN